MQVIVYERKVVLIMENIKVVRYYESNKNPICFYVQAKSDYKKGGYTFGRYNTLEDAKKAIKEFKNGSFKNTDFYILEML